MGHKRLRVLIAEQDFGASVEIVEECTVAGISVVGRARDGKEAVVLATELKPDAVLLDLENPALRGIWTSQELQKGPRVPVILLTEQPLSEFVGLVALAGAAGCLHKPASGQEIRAAIQSAWRSIH